MNIIFKKSFQKDLKRIKNKAVLSHINQIILEAETTSNIFSLPHIKKIKVTHKNINLFRIRTGQYRIGLILQKDTITFVRVLHRKDIYKYFP